MPLGDSHNGQLVAQERGVRGESRDGRLAASRRPAEQIRPPIPDEACGVQDEPASLDKCQGVEDPQEAVDGDVVGTGQREVGRTLAEIDSPRADRKSTRLNSSHRCSSYAVFCLKK